MQMIDGKAGIPSRNQIELHQLGTSINFQGDFQITSFRVPFSIGLITQWIGWASIILIQASLWLSLLTPFMI